jgi:hypothetical protein
MDADHNNKELNSPASNSSANAHPPGFIPPSSRAPYDKHVTLEEYMYYAAKTREQEKLEDANNPQEGTGILSGLFKRKTQKSGSLAPSSPTASHEKVANSDEETSANGRAVISPDEWRDASRLMRTASCENDGLYCYGG